ncbi:SDR family NAD(P)-dependent oxidoreductase [Rhodopseudomonas sp. RCAM05734]|uniref:SDR family NAD(P)-dependent oxidoreductase n=1 Tax=Rhodopseudomonas sp. RCAM05734 TaxID=3457549 RepID=UPI0040449CB8
MDILITGAASGIGRAAALAFVRDAQARGEPAPRLTLVDLNSGSLEETVRLLPAGIEVATEALDLAKPDEARQLVERAIGRYGGLDTIVSNAGIGIPSTLQDLSLENYERTFMVNTRATWLLGQAALPHMKERGGSIVATASISAQAPTPTLGVYGPSKAALVALIKQMALEWGPFGIRCNCVSPGPTLTGMTARSYSDPETRRCREEAIPIHRLGQPEDSANAIVMLSRPEASFISGVDLPVDGGLLTTLMQATGYRP